MVKCVKRLLLIVQLSIDTTDVAERVGFFTPITDCPKKRQSLVKGLQRFLPLVQISIDSADVVQHPPLKRPIPHGSSKRKRLLVVAQSFWSVCLIGENLSYVV